MHAPAQPQRVLVVDDDEMLLALVRVTLEKDGVEVATATRGEEALAAAASTSFDLVILDILMPGISGWEVLRRLRATDDVPVLILSTRDSEIDIARGLDLGADDYVAKPFGLLEFEARVNAQLRRRARAPKEHGVAAA